MQTSTVTPPPPSVLSAFNLEGSATPLSGGQGRSFLVSSFVLKPPEDLIGAEWSSQVMAALSSSPSASFRVPTPPLASNAKYVYEGWTTSSFYPGEENPTGKCEELLIASRAFHEALKDFPEPDFLSRREHPWAVGDRVAWGEASIKVDPRLALIYNELLDLRQEVSTSKPQLVHGDLSGNVPFSQRMPPVIIDFSPFWRCVGYSEAIAVVDGVMDFGQGKELLDLGSIGYEWYQMLVRALIFRLVARSELRQVFGEISEREVVLFRGATNLVKEKIRMENSAGSEVSGWWTDEASMCTGSKHSFNS
jgi:uncharacterized protein (TIGR02569 family)